MFMHLSSATFSSFKLFDFYGLEFVEGFVFPFLSVLFGTNEGVYFLLAYYVFS